MNYFDDSYDVVSPSGKRDIYNLNNFNDINNDNYYVFDITFNNKGVNTFTLNGEDLTHKIEEPDFAIDFKDIFKGYKKYKHLLETRFMVYVRQKTTKPMTLRTNDISHGMNDKHLYQIQDLSELRLCFTSTRSTDYIKITLIKNVRFISHDKTNYFLNNKISSIYIFAKYTEIYAFEIRTKSNSLQFSNFNKKIVLPIKYNSDNGEMECHVFSKIINENVTYIFYITKLILPDGNIINYSTHKSCKCCIDYSKRFDICDESKYQLLCSNYILNTRIKLRELLSVRNYEIVFETNKLSIFNDKFGKDYIIKTYSKPF